jgi:4-diphosphocytidyl-2-C-methyl-D-erythritol kinase
METIKVKTPAKINLTLEVMNTRPDGFHDIQSIMQAISLCDYVTISAEPSDTTEITLSGTSDVIPYNEKNLAYKAAKLLLDKANENYKVHIYIEKNIPIEAGLAGGSANAAGVFYGLNKLIKNKLTIEQITELCAQIGSDISFCLFGGTKLATSKGDDLKKLDTPELKLVLIKPKSFGISAKEAYQKYDLLEDKSNQNATFHMMMAINKKQDVSNLMVNDLERAIDADYPKIGEIREYLLSIGCKAAMMSGSGSTVFGIIDKDIEVPSYPDAECFIAESVNHGVRVV